MPTDFSCADNERRAPVRREFKATSKPLIDADLRRRMTARSIGG